MWRAGLQSQNTGFICESRHFLGVSTDVGSGDRYSPPSPVTNCQREFSDSTDLSRPYFSLL